MEIFRHKSNTYIDINGAKIYYEDIGDKTFPALLYIDKIFSKVMQLALDTSISGRPNESVKIIKSSVLAIRGENDPIVSKESLDELCHLVKNAVALNIPTVTR